MSIHILLVEPHVSLADTYTRALEAAGYNVAWVGGAQAAVHAADEHQPDIVVLELRLASHDGIEFLQEFRSYPEWQDIPVVINTMLAHSSLRVVKAELVKQYGVREVLYKPQTSLQRLLRTVREHTGQA